MESKIVCEFCGCAVSLGAKNNVCPCCGTEYNADGCLVRCRVKEARSVDCHECGRKVRLIDSWSNRCACGAEYNLFGGLVVSREQWNKEIEAMWS